jgi:hypothetical protein
MTDEDYRILLRETRSQIWNLGLSSLDEKITSDFRESDGPFYDLLFYLKHVREEVQLGADTQFRDTRRRVFRYVHTGSHEPVSGIRIDLTPEDIERYGMRYLDLAPSHEFGAVAKELAELIDALVEQHNQERNRETHDEQTNREEKD